MTFLNPFVLLGLIAAGIPLLLHLLNLRKLKTIEFSTLRFVKELQKTQIRRLKLQQILLLILRTLIVVFAVLAFSRPVLKSKIPVFGSHVKSSVVVLVDNSLSMDCSDEGGNRMKQARAAAQQIVSALKDGDELALICAGDVGSDQKISFSRNTALLAERVQKLTTAPRTAEMSAMLKIASSLLADAQNVNKEVYLISDAQRNSFNGEADSVRSSVHGATLFVVPVGAGAKIAGQNLSVDSVRISSAIFQRDKAVDVEAIIRNCSETDARGVVVGLSYNGLRVAQRSVDIPAGQVRSMMLSAAAPGTGAVRGLVELEGDALESDNKRAFSFIIPPAPNIALIGDAESCTWLQSVLQLEAGRELFHVETFRPNQFSGLNLAKYDVLLLCSALSPADNRRLGDYAQHGGSVFLFAFDDKAELNRSTQTLGFSDVGETRVEKGQHLEFSATDKEHPLFRGVFKNTDNARAVVESPRMDQAYPALAGQEIISMQGGAFLAESRPGEGRALYCAVPPTTSWSNFPLTGIFPTIIFRSIPYLSAREQVGASYLCGRPLRYVLPKRYSAAGRVIVSDPSGVESTRDALVLSTGAMLNVGMQQQVGTTIVKSTDGQDLCSFSANVDASESQLSFFSPDQYRSELARRLDAGSLVEVLDIHAGISDGVARARNGTELWKLFVILAICCALAEMVVARRSSRAVLAEA